MLGVRLRGQQLSQLAALLRRGGGGADATHPELRRPRRVPPGSQVVRRSPRGAVSPPSVPRARLPRCRRRLRRPAAPLPAGRPAPVRGRPGRGRGDRCGVRATPSGSRALVATGDGCDAAGLCAQPRRARAHGLRRGNVAVLPRGDGDAQRGGDDHGRRARGPRHRRVERARHRARFARDRGRRRAPRERARPRAAAGRQRADGRAGVRQAPMDRPLARGPARGAAGARPRPAGRAHARRCARRPRAPGRTARRRVAEHPGSASARRAAAPVELERAGRHQGIDRLGAAAGAVSRPLRAVPARQPARRDGALGDAAGASTCPPREGRAARLDGRFHERFARCRGHGRAADRRDGADGLCRRVPDDPGVVVPIPAAAAARPSLRATRARRPVHEAQLRRGARRADDRARHRGDRASRRAGDQSVP